MPTYEEQASELLSKYIEEIKRVDGADAINFIARTPIDPVELSTLFPLADDLQEIMGSECCGASGQDIARDRLLDEIHADSRPSRRPLSLPDLAPAPTRQGFFPRGRRQLGLAFALVLLTLLSALALAKLLRKSADSCVVVSPAPKAAAPKPSAPVVGK